MNEKVLSFYVNERLFGIKVTLIKEINRNIEYSIVPDTNAQIVGLFNMRGQIVTLFDLVQLLCLNECEPKNRNTCIIIKANPNDPNQFGFLIDTLGDVIDMNLEDCESPPANVVGVESEYISSIVKLDGKLMMLLDPIKLYHQYI